MNHRKTVLKLRTIPSHLAWNKDQIENESISIANLSYQRLLFCKPPEGSATLQDHGKPQSTEHTQSDTHLSQLHQHDAVISNKVSYLTPYVCIDYFDIGSNRHLSTPSITFQKVEEQDTQSTASSSKLKVSMQEQKKYQTLPITTNSINLDTQWETKRHPKDEILTKRQDTQGVNSKVSSISDVVTQDHKGEVVSTQSIRMYLQKEFSIAIAKDGVGCERSLKGSDTPYSGLTSLKKGNWRLGILK